MQVQAADSSGALCFRGCRVCVGADGRVAPTAAATQRGCCQRRRKRQEAAVSGKRDQRCLLRGHSGGDRRRRVIPRAGAPAKLPDPAMQ